MGYWDKKQTKNKKREQEEKCGLAAVEQEALEELTELERGFRERVKAENKRFRDMCDTEYWFCVCFTSREQKEEFMKKIGLDINEKYFDGKDVAKAFKKTISTPDIEFARIKPPDQDWSDRVR